MDETPIEILENAAGEVYLGRGLEVRSLGRVTAGMRGRAQEDAHAWTCGQWQPARRPSDRASTLGLARIAVWTAGEGLKIEYRDHDSAPVAGPAGAAYLGLDFEGNELSRLVSERLDVDRWLPAAMLAEWNRGVSKNEIARRVAPIWSRQTAFSVLDHAIVTDRARRSLLDAGIAIYDRETGEGLCDVYTGFKHRVMLMLARGYVEAADPDHLTATAQTVVAALHDADLQLLESRYDPLPLSGVEAAARLIRPGEGRLQVGLPALGRRNTGRS